MIEVLSATWYTPFTGDLSLIGIVKVKTIDGIKYYIGTGKGDSVKEDIDEIIKYGAPFYPEVFKDEKN